jgi:hypothetical protein
LYTSEYFNRYYSDTSVLDFQSQEVELQIQSDVLLEEKSNQINKGTITASPTYSSKVPTTDYQGYPFYYIENRHNVKDYDLTVNNYLSYDSFDSKNEVWDFPFVLDESNISTEVDIRNEKAKISDLVIYGNFINDIQQDQEFEKSEELKNDTVSFTSSYSGNTLSVNINTFAKYLAETTVADVKATSGTGFRSYMHEDN